MSISFSIGNCKYKERVILKAPGKTKKSILDFGVTLKQIKL